MVDIVYLFTELRILIPFKCDVVIGIIRNQ